MNRVGTVSNITVGRFEGGGGGVGGVECSPSSLPATLQSLVRAIVSLKTVPEFNSFLYRPRLTLEVKMTK